MSDYIPEPWAFALITLAAWRLWKLIGDDTVFEKQIDWLLRRLPAARRAYWRTFLECPYCSGHWYAGIAYAIWLSILGDWPDTVGEVVGVVGVWFALSAAVGLLGTAWQALADAQDE